LKGAAASLPSSVHSRTVSSAPPEAMRVPSGENATLKTLPSWPLKGVAASLPSSVHSRTVPSSPPEAMRVPSGENATLRTLPS
jgi:hypothetical protein